MDENPYQSPRANDAKPRWRWLFLWLLTCIFVIAALSLLVVVYDLWVLPWVP